MPLNILRLNHPTPSAHPNDRITFIKPLPRPQSLQADYVRATTFLNAIAAQCLPVMTAHHLSVTTLEEHEPNREFIGRNFNNGEVIQLVLQRRRSRECEGEEEGGSGGGWLSFRQVQMVMMHELAHNLQMNHGKQFWVERNQFAAQMKGLWERGYTGEGFWCQGRRLEGLPGQFEAGNTVDIGVGREVEGLCGGTFRSRKRGRKRKREALTWKEQKERRVERKFGKNGMALGEDEEARVRLELGRKGPIGGKPRVAGSKRGRELRAAAALARFEIQKDEHKAKSEGMEEDSVENDLDSEWEEPALNHEGKRILDSRGIGMVRVCSEEDKGDETNVKEEMEDFAAAVERSTAKEKQKPHELIPPPDKSNQRLSTNRAIPPVTAETDLDRARRILYSIPQHPRSNSPPP